MNYWSKELYIIEDQNFRRTRVRLCNREKLEGLSFRQLSIYCWGGRGYPFFLVLWWLVFSQPSSKSRVPGYCYLDCDGYEILRLFLRRQFCASSASLPSFQFPPILSLLPSFSLSWRFWFRLKSWYISPTVSYIYYFNLLSKYILGHWLKVSQFQNEFIKPLCLQKYKRRNFINSFWNWLTFNMCLFIYNIFRLLLI